MTAFALGEDVLQQSSEECTRGQEYCSLCCRLSVTSPEEHLTDEHGHNLSAYNTPSMLRGNPMQQPPVQRPCDDRD